MAGPATLGTTQISLYMIRRTEVLHESNTTNISQEDGPDYMRMF
jgi:hypothetical protein